MPVEAVTTTRKGRRVTGHRWGKHGTIYVGKGSKGKAEKQGRAIEAPKHGTSKK
jgi:hypothetical protein